VQVGTNFVSHVFAEETQSVADSAIATPRKKKKKTGAKKSELLEVTF
jgi:hypothetical protein